MVTVNTFNPAASASQFAQFFNDEGSDVRWEAPIEKRYGASQELVRALFILVEKAGEDLYAGAVMFAAGTRTEKIRARFP